MGGVYCHRLQRICQDGACRRSGGCRDEQYAVAEAAVREIQRRHAETVEARAILHLHGVWPDRGRWPAEG